MAVEAFHYGSAVGRWRQERRGRGESVDEDGGLPSVHRCLPPPSPPSCRPISNTKLRKYFILYIYIYPQQLRIDGTKMLYLGWGYSSISLEINSRLRRFKKMHRVQHYRIICYVMV